nr:histidine kinase [Frigoribacterium sp. RIT-PI-h]
MEPSITAPAPAATPSDARRPLTRRDTRVDLWIAALTAVLGLATLWLSAVIVADTDGAASPSIVESVLWLVGLCAPLAFRRQRPVAVLVVVSAVFLAAQLRGYPDTLTPSIVEFVAIFTANAWAARRARALVVSVVVTAIMFVWLGVWLRSVYVSDAETPDPVTLASIAYTLVSNGIVLVTAIAFGRAARVSATRLHALERTGVELRAAHELVADRAINEERTRLARELHDVVAHHVAVIGIQAGAARRTLDRPEIARGARSAGEGTARTTLDEPARQPSVLRSRDGAAGSAPAGLGPCRNSWPTRAPSVSRSGSRFTATPTTSPRASGSRSTASPKRRSPTPSSTATPRSPRCSSATETAPSRSRSSTTAVPAPRPTPGQACHRAWPRPAPDWANGACANGSTCTAVSSGSAPDRAGATGCTPSCP